MLLEYLVYSTSIFSLWSCSFVRKVKNSLGYFSANKKIFFLKKKLPHNFICFLKHDILELVLTCSVHQ